MAKVILLNKAEIQKEIELAGWMASVSYDGKTAHDIVAKHCINSNHGTPTRAMRFIFEISEVSRAFSHEFVRHELGVAKVQRSQRYVNEDGFQYVTPKGIMDIRVLVKVPIMEMHFVTGEYIHTGDVETWLTFDQFQDLVKQMYTGFINAGAKPEDARYVLSNATFTKLHVVFDWEGLDNFCFRRCCTRAQWEIRDVAYQAKAEVNSVNEFLASKLGAPCDKYLFCTEGKSCGKAPNKEDFKKYFDLGVAKSKEMIW